MQAKVLLQIDRLADKAEGLALSEVADEAVAAKLSGVGFEDIVDLHLMKFPETAVLSTQVSLDDLKALKKKATAKLSSLLGIQLEG